MGFSCGIVGLPNVGKSTIFNALGNAHAESANFPFCTIEPNVGVVPVPDPRLDRISAIVQPQNVVPSTMTFVDIAGLVEGASRGEGLGNKFLANIRECHAIAHVVRCFESEDIVHVAGSVDPLRDIEIIDTELILKDMETVDKRVDRIERQAKSGDKALKRELDLLREVQAHLDAGNPYRSMPESPERDEVVRTLHLLTAKRVMYVCNVADDDPLGENNRFVAAVREHAAVEGSEVVVFSAALEAEIQELDDAEEREMFLADAGISEPGLHRMIRAGYALLGLQTYFTAGEKEVRAWPVRTGATAPEAAGVIHTDFQRGFIKAEVISYDDYLTHDGEKGARNAGRLRIEGKEYVLSDGDVMHFRFNV